MSTDTSETSSNSADHTVPPDSPELHDALKHHFGYETFKPLQEEVIRHSMAGRDGVLLLPTGGGKSICYQLPAIISGGLTLVVSPLISLMQDQVQSLRQNGIPAAFLNSSMTSGEEREVYNSIENKELRLLYAAPERVLREDFLNVLGNSGLERIAIDEAHCVSSWGHSFRPVYRKLSELKHRFPSVPVLALTATADRSVRRDIAGLLGLNNPQLFLGSFDRPNIRLSVLPGKERFEQILHMVLRYRDESGIVYCGSRKACEQLEKKLRAKGVSARAYHAGLDSESRRRIQSDFIRDKIQVITATIAFGMGIDKPDVRFVIHYNMPGNLESYYQEIGRAGRDGEDAEAVLFYSYRDIQQQLNFISQIEHDDYRSIQEVKLKRMQEYAESHVCRRRVLLAYFNEITEEDCGNCDVCSNPPEYIEGTIIAQKALSAVKRCREAISAGTLVDVLRGNMSREVEQRGLHRIPTFAVGRDISPAAWQQYIQQLIHLGALEPDYRDHFTLKIPEQGNDILFKDRKVKLVSMDTISKRREQQANLRLHVESEQIVNQDLLEALKKLRRRLAEESAVPPYVVFSDASLKDMAARKPLSELAFRMVKGVGDHKAELYSAVFIQCIREYGE